MPRPTITERARAYIGVMPAPRRAKSDPQDSHAVVFGAACALVKGFNLSRAQAEPLLREFCLRSDEPWRDREIDHKLQQAEAIPDALPRGYLIGEHRDAEIGEAGPVHRPLPPPAPTYDLAALKEFSGPWSGVVDLVWLANRSALDPASVDAGDYLQALYGPDERVLLFNECSYQGSQISQGEAVWPEDKPLRTGKYGVWMLPQPVDGEYHPNPRSEDKEGNAKMSRRSEESCLHFPFLVLESDEAPAREWLGALVQLPCRIAAIYTSGGRSVHALVKVKARTKREWDAIKKSLMPSFRFLISQGLDKGVLSAVRLTRLPGAFREGKAVELDNGRFVYEKFPRPRLQKLLYLNPNPEARPICEIFPKRDVEEHWCQQASLGISDADAEGGRWLKAGLHYYARQSPRIAAALERLNEMEVSP